MPREHGPRLAEAFPDGRLVEIDDSYTLVPIDQPAVLAAAAAGVRRPPERGGARRRGTVERVPSRAMSIAIITGSGTHALPGFEGGESVRSTTPFGAAAVTRGRFAGADALHVSRHGADHVRLSNHVTHRANIWALKQLGATAVVGCTACGAVDPTLELGSLVVFDDLHFISNRLPDGTLCTFFDRARRPRARALDPPRRAVLAGGAPGAAGRRRAGRARRARRRRLRARRRPALQHPGRDRAARRLRRGRGQPDRRTRRPSCAASSSCRSG